MIYLAKLRGRVSCGTTITSVPKGDTPTCHVDALTLNLSLRSRGRRCEVEHVVLRVHFFSSLRSKIRPQTIFIIVCIYMLYIHMQVEIG